MGRSGAQRSVAGLEGSQSALSFSSLKGPTVKVL